MSSPLDQNQKWKDLYGDIYPFKLGGEAYVYVDSPHWLNQFYVFHRTGIETNNGRSWL